MCFINLFSSFTCIILEKTLESYIFLEKNNTGIFIGVLRNVYILAGNKLATSIFSILLCL